MIKLLLSLFLLSVVSISSIQAQQATTTAGGEASGSGGTASYTVGQTVYTTNTSTNGNTIAQGVQQPFEISTTIGINETSIKLEMSVYPNPTTNYLTLKVDDSAMLNNQQLSYHLYDLQGKLIESKKVISNSSNISLENQPTATYLLKVTRNNQVIKIFKIIKN
jgi:hypothetical protein